MRVPVQTLVVGWSFWSPNPGNSASFCCCTLLFVGIFNAKKPTLLFFPYHSSSSLSSFQSLVRITGLDWVGIGTTLNQLGFYWLKLLQWICPIIQSPHSFYLFSILFSSTSEDESIRIRDIFFTTLSQLDFVHLRTVIYD